MSISKYEEVLTQTGYKPSYACKQGDKTVGENGEWTNILLAEETPAVTNLLKIRVNLDIETLNVTPDQDILTPTGFSPAYLLKENSQICVAINRDVSKFGPIDLEQYASKYDIVEQNGIRNYVTNKEKYINRHLIVDNDFCRFIGHYVRCSSAHEHLEKAVMHVPTVNQEEIEFVTNYAKQISNVVNIKVKETQFHSTKIKLQKRVIVKLLYDLFWTNLDRKLPYWMLPLDIDLQKTFLRSLFCKPKFSTSSKALVNALRILLYRTQTPFRIKPRYCNWLNKPWIYTIFIDGKTNTYINGCATYTIKSIESKKSEITYNIVTDNGSYTTKLATLKSHTYA